MKKAIFFTIDSLLASGIVILAIFLISDFYSVEPESTNINYASYDLARVFSAMTVGEVSNDYVKSLISSGEITNTNNTIIEQIGDFWAREKPELAKNMTKNLTEAIFPQGYGFSVLVNDEVIYSRNNSVKGNLVSSRRIVSGISKSKPTEGYTARVLLGRIKSKKTSAYAYFGGYEGDGNITKKIVLPNDVISFNSSYIEADAGGDFDLYINGAFSGSYTKGSGGGGGVLADKWNISSAYLANYRPGENTLNINFTSGIGYIAGGFIRITYTTSSYNDTQTSGYEKYAFPGISGVINIYSSVYVPGALNSMEIFLNYSSNYTTFLKLGNWTVYEASTNGSSINVTLSNSTLSALLDYSLFSQRTVPLRLGISNATTLGGIADAVLVSDVSGSMEWCEKVNTVYYGGSKISASKGCYRFFGFWWWDYYNFTPNNGFSDYNRTTWNNGTNDLCSCRWNSVCKNDTKKIDVYKNSSRDFTEIFYNVSGNRLGLVEFSSSNADTVYNGSCSTSSSTTTVFPEGIARIDNLTTNKSKIIDSLNLTSSWWGTCICCGINKGVDLIQTQNSSSRKKFIILMSDGEATVSCSQQPNSTATADAVQAAWDACSKNISVYTIAFGADSDSQTMGRMNCSSGKSFNATNTTKLQEAYNEIAGEINKLSFSGQLVNVTGALARSVIHPNSYIGFNYSTAESQFNKIPISFETERFGNNASSGNLSIYANTSVLDAKVTSYSGTKWTDKLVVNGNNVFLLSDYGSDYQSLGDPFAVNIQPSIINEGINSIAISTGLNSTVPAGGSNDSRVVYTLLLNAFADYSSVVAKSDGCSWTVSFEDSTASTVKVPSNYNGADLCSLLTKTYDANDALDNSVYQLFSYLDIDKDGLLDINVDDSSLDVNTLTISKVPSMWGPAIIEIRVWE